MITFQILALLLTLLWLLLVTLRFRRSSAILIGGLAAIGVFTLAALVMGKVRLAELGLSYTHSGLLTIGFALAGLVITLAYSPLADRLASRVFKAPPTLEAFGAIQRSWMNLVLGIVVAWLLGGILEELMARGIVLQAIEAGLRGWLGAPLAAGAAICLAAAGAGLMHSYQGLRAMLIIGQISLLFGLLFVLSGYNLWAVMLCHGLYDTIAFVRFARGKSRYAGGKEIG